MNLFEEVYGKFQFDKTKTIKVVECFAGIGTQAMALKRLARDYNLKFEFVAISEIDKYAIQSYNAIHGKTHNLGAIGEFERFPKDIDICSWSFPCQDISLAGRQKGLVENTRSNYGFVFLDTVKNTPKEERPKILLMENVPALVSEKFQKDYQEIHRRLEEMGYTSWGGLMNAKNYGVAQNRERIFIVSILGESSYSFPQPFPLVKRLKDYLEESVDEKYYLSKKMIKGMETTKFHQYQLRNRTQDQEGVANTIMAKFESAPAVITERYCGTYQHSKSENFMKGKDRFVPNKEIADTLVSNTKEGIVELVPYGSYYTWEDNKGIGNQEMNAVIKIPEATKKGYAEAEDGDGVYINRPHQKRGVVQKGMIQTIKTRAGDLGVVVLVPYGSYYTWEDKKRNLNTQCNRAVDENVVALTVAVAQGGNVVEKQPKLRIRKLTPKETWRLMGIDDEDFDKAQASGLSDTQLYKQAGNAIVVDVLYYIFKNLFDLEGVKND